MIDGTTAEGIWVQVPCEHREHGAELYVRKDRAQRLQTGIRRYCCASCQEGIDVINALAAS